MKIKFSDSIQDKLAKLRLGIITFEAYVTESSKDFWRVVDRKSIEIRSILKSEDITKIQTISDTRAAYKQCGKDPSRYRPSADSLIRRIVKGNDLYKVNNVVDVLNLISIESGFSIGGYDITKITGQPVLDIGTADDEYYGIGRGLLNVDGLPVLRDETSIYGSPTSDSERTMITTGNHQLAFVFFDFGYSESLDKTITQAIEYLQLYAQAKELKKDIISF